MITTVLSNVIGNGAKFVATNLAVACKIVYGEKKVLLVDFDLENPTLGKVFYAGNRNNSFNVMLNELLQHNNISEEILKENLYSSLNGIDILIGRNIDEIDYYNDISEDLYKKLFLKLSSMYDYIFVVINKEPNNKIMLTTLLNSNNTIVVGKNTFSNELALNRTFDIVSNYTNNANQYYITNMYEKEKMDLSRKIKNKGITFLGNLRYEYSSIDNKNLKGKFYNKFNSNNRLFIKTIKMLGEK